MTYFALGCKHKTRVHVTMCFTGNVTHQKNMHEFDKENKAPRCKRCAQRAPHGVQWTTNMICIYAWLCAHWHMHMHPLTAQRPTLDKLAMVEPATKVFCIKVL